MNISSDIIKDGHITIFTDTPEEIEQGLIEYNKLMSDCSLKKFH